MSNDVSPSIVSKRHTEDCLPCRLVSGFGVVGIGLYLYNTGRKYPNGINRSLIYGLSIGKENITLQRLIYGCRIIKILCSYF